MTPTQYYRFERITTKSKYRLDCAASTMGYSVFESMRATKKRGTTTQKGDLYFYFLDVPRQFGGDIHSKATKSLTTSKGHNLSSMIAPDQTSRYAFGDVRGTNDAILFVIDGVQGAAVELFIFEGQAHKKRIIWQMASRGELDKELAAIRTQARPQARAQVQGVLPLY